jgi:hypothetical protein
LRTNVLVKIINVIKFLAITYLSMKMICFAIPKFLFMQFRGYHYKSFIPLAEISTTQHMWSFFGRSYHYNLFIGSAEFLIGILIVFKRTRLIALLLSIGVCSNILILNIEFDIDFAIQHASLDFIITVLLLFDYRKDLYVFFIAFGGKLKSEVTATRNSFFKKLPYVYIILFPIGYFIFAYKVRSTINEELIGSYKIKNFQMGEHHFALGKGKLGSSPMIFFEHNDIVVLSVNDSIYLGRYLAKNDSINLYFNPSIEIKSSKVIQIKSIKADFKGNSLLKGKINDSTSIDMKVERLSVKEDYLNNLYTR